MDINTCPVGDRSMFSQSVSISGTNGIQIVTHDGGLLLKEIKTPRNTTNANKIKAELHLKKQY